jgi:hypothetical protein
MYKPIFLSCCLYGSVYIFCTSLTMINMTILEKKKVPRELILLNGLTLISSGYIFLSTVKLLLSSPSHMK